MKTDAEANRDVDEKRRAEVGIRNKADQQVWQTEKQIEEQAESLDADSKAKLEAGVERVKEALKGSDIDEIKSSSDDLEKIWHEAASKMYEKAQAEQAQAEPQGDAGQAGAGGASAGSSQGDDVEDASYEVVE